MLQKRVADAPVSGEPDSRRRREDSDNPSDNEMDAALALSGLIGGAASASTTPASAAPAPAAPLANAVTRLPNASTTFPYLPGKGWFVKMPDGSDTPFLERLFLILSFPKARLITRPGLCLSDAIRWKDRGAAALCGAPSSAPCIEIVNVSLFEAEIYPQYASGSFNKTATKWGLISPSPSPERSGKKLLRECMYMPATLVGGKPIYPLHPLPAEIMPNEVNDYIARHLRPLAHAHRTSAAERLAAKAEPSAALGKVLMPDGAGALDDGAMRKIMTIVKRTTDYQLNGDQLRAILALKEGDGSPVSPQKELAASLVGAPPTTLPRASAPTPKQPSPPKSASSSSRSVGRMASSWDQLRVTLWDKNLRKRVPGSSYSGDLSAFLARNPHMEVYNRQDEAPKPGQQLLAGQKTQKLGDALSQGLGLRTDLAKVSIWHATEQRKLTAAESPTRAQLFKFLQEHPDVVVYEGQTASARPPPETDSSDGNLSDVMETGGGAHSPDASTTADSGDEHTSTASSDTEPCATDAKPEAREPADHSTGSAMEQQQRLLNQILSLEPAAGLHQMLAAGLNRTATSAGLGAFSALAQLVSKVATSPEQTQTLQQVQTAMEHQVQSAVQTAVQQQMHQIQQVQQQVQQVQQLALGAQAAAALSSTARSNADFRWKGPIVFS